MKFCKHCGWLMEYRPRSFQEHIQEIIGNQNKKGYWKCLNCKVQINNEESQKDLIEKKMINERRINDNKL